MSTTIEVSLDPETLKRLDHDIHAGIYLLKQLRERGVPVIGSIWPIGVEHGTLTLSVDAVFGDRTWTWKP